MDSQSQHTPRGDGSSIPQARVWEAIEAALSSAKLGAGYSGGPTQDHLHEAILRAARKPSNELPSDVASLCQFIFGIVRKIALQEARKGSREQPSGLFTDSPPHQAVRDAGLRRLEDEEERVKLEQHLAGLRPVDLEVLLAIAEGASIAEVALRLGKTPGAVRSHLRNARLAATEALQRATRSGPSPALRRDGL